MIVQIDVDGESVPLDQSGYRPPTLGDFLRGAIQRRGLTIEGVARRSGLPTAMLTEILDDTRPLDKASARRLQAVFPRAASLLLRIQETSQYFQRYGVLRPASPLKRRLLERRLRQAHRAAA